MIKIIVNGAAGRMGETVARLIQEDPGLKLVGAIELPANAKIGKDAGGVQISGNLSEKIRITDVVLDFSSPNAVLALAEAAIKWGKALVIGTTGHTPGQVALLKDASRKIAILISPNMSVGINLLWKLTELSSQTLDESYSIEIKERHHVHKKDSPSGTAKRLVEILRAASREPASVKAIREGEIVGEHIVSFASTGERIELGHYAFTREIFAKGAIRAAKWIVDKPAGLYDMQNVLFHV